MKSIEVERILKVNGTIDKKIFITGFIIITTALFFAEIFLAQFLYVDLNFFTTPLSFYAIGQYWYLVSSGLFFIAINYVLLGIYFFNIKTQMQGQLRIGAGFLIFAGVNTLLLTVLQTDTGGEKTLVGTLHVVTAHLHFVSLPVAAFLISSGLPGDQFLRYKKLTNLFGFILTFTGIALIFKGSILSCIKPVSGCIQKSLILVILIWIIFSGITIRKLIVHYVNGNGEV